MSPEVIHRITSGVAALAICACLAVGSLAFTRGAEARVNGPRTTEQVQDCGWIQDQFDLFASEVDSQDAHAAVENMHDFEASWYQMGCDADFGSIVVKPAR